MIHNFIKLLVFTFTMSVIVFVFPVVSHANNNLLVLTITSEHCVNCQKLKPVLKELEDEYFGQIEFLTLELSSRDLIEEAKQRAEEYEIVEIFENNKNAMPKVLILCPGGKVEKSFLGETRKDVYKHAIDDLILNEAELCSI